MNKLNANEFIGKKFGYLTVIEYIGVINQYSTVRVICVCNKIKQVKLSLLKIGRTKSCGCAPDAIKSHPTHGLSNTYHSTIWNSMKQRCYNKLHESYSDYGARGIKVCDRWINSLTNFAEDMGERPDKTYSLDRIDNNGNYEPNNCKWSTAKEQANNRRKSRCRHFIQ